MGDLGQTLDSARTLQHLVTVQPQSILNVGDLSYADGYHPRWDTYGRLVQPSTAQVAWMNIEGATPHADPPHCCVPPPPGFAMLGHQVSCICFKAQQNQMSSL